MELKLKKTDGIFGMELENEKGFTVRMDAKEDLGGTASGYGPMELLAGSLAGCSSIDILHILNKQRIQPEKFEVKTLATRVKDEIPAVFERIELIYQASAEVPLEKLERAAALSIEKYCSVSRMLAPSCEITYKVEHID